MTTPLFQPYFVLVAICHFPFLDMTELAVVLLLYTRAYLTLAWPGVNHSKQWNQLASVSILETG